MERFLRDRNRLLAEKVIKGLASRNMQGYYAETKEEACQKALELMPPGSKVGWGGSFTLSETGLKQAVLEGNYEVKNRDTAKSAEERREADLWAYGADYYLASSNAVTEDGILVNIDGNGNRTSCMIYGPLHVILLVGMNKIEKDLDAAVYRARGIAATANAQRFPIDTPCKKTGACANCKSPDTICCQFLITRYSKHPGRIHVILINDNLGF